MRLSVLALTLLFFAPASARASYAFYVGRGLTTDGSVLVGGTGEEVSSHWLALAPARAPASGATVEVGVTAEAELPGERSSIPEVKRTYRYLAMLYSDFKGFPPPLTNGGLNEHGLAVRDVWAPSREELVALTPRPQRGLSYSDLARLALERARTAREAVALVGELIEAHGYATYGSNTHLFADAREGWVVWELAGGQGLWAAERLGPDEVRVLYPGYIGEIPENYREHPGFDGSKNLVRFAIEKGWYDPRAGEPFDVHRVYGAQGRGMRRPGIKYVDAATLEEELLALRGTIDVETMMRFVRDPRIADEEAGYGQVARLGRAKHARLRVLWVAPTGSVSAPFVPWFLGVEAIPPEYRQHRYLTKSAATHFLSPSHQLDESTAFAGRTFKRLLYVTCAHPEKFLPEVTEALEAFEKKSRSELPSVRRSARILLEGGEETLAAELLTRYSSGRAGAAHRLGAALLGSIEARSALLFGYPEPEGDINAPHGAPTPNCLASADPDRPPLTK